MVLIIRDDMYNILRLDENMLVGKDFRIFASKTVHNTGLHWHSYCELIYFYNGALESTINGKKVVLHEGTVYMMSPLDLHHTIAKNENEPISFVNISFKESVADNKISSRLNCPYYIENSGDRIKTLFDLILCSEDDDEKRHIINVILYNIVNDVNKLENRKGEAIVNQNVLACIRYISDNFNNDITLQSAAKHLHLAPAYLSNLFSKSCGCTFKEYITSFRLSHAKSLLKTSNLSITEICFICGFNNLASFFRCFKRELNLTPAEYRKSVVI